MRFSLLLFPSLGFFHGLQRCSAASVNRLVSTVSPFLVAPSISKVAPNGVSGEQWADWGGEIDYQDCWEALAKLQARVPSDHPYVFWSGTAGDMPPPSIPWPWRLPAHADTGHCTLLVRMLRDFDSNTLPIDGSRTYDTSRCKRFSPSTWPHIFAAGTDIILACLKPTEATGGWIQVNDDIAVFLLPWSSLMRFYWANEMAAGNVHSRNQTSRLQAIKPTNARTNTT